MRKKNYRDIESLANFCRTHITFALEVSILLEFKNLFGASQKRKQKMVENQLKLSIIKR